MNAPRLNDQAVENGVLKRVSPSQIKTFRSCPRKWWYEKVAKAPAPRWSAATNLGTNIHTELENYYLHGHEPQHPLIQPGRHLLPERHEQIAVEIQLADPWLYAGAVLVTGFIDLVLPHTDPLQIVDWKSTSNILKYGKTRSELATDVQMAIYAKWAQHKYDVDEVTVAHVQFQTKGDPLARRVEWEHTVDTVKPLWLSIESDVAEMSRCASLKTPEEVTPNLGACNDYGGCPYRGICPATKTGARNMSLLEKLKAKTAPAATPEVKPEPPIEHTVIPPDAALEEPVATVAPTNPDVVESNIKALEADEARIMRVQPTKAKENVGKTHFVGDDCPGGHADVALAATPEATPAPEQKRRPGRPKMTPEEKAAKAAAKSQTSAAEPAYTDGHGKPAPAPIPVGPPKDEPKPQNTTPGKVGLTLYINCRPDHSCQSLAQFTAECAAEVAKTCDVPDVRLCGGELGYNKWKGALAALAASKAPHGEFWTLTGEVEDAIISGLVPLASVVRGVR